MSVVAQSADQIRSIIARVVGARWPDESLIFTTECLRERRKPPAIPAHQPGSLGGPVVDSLRSDRGVVGATERRFVFHYRLPFAACSRGLGLVLGGVALLVLLLGSGLSGFVPLAGVAVALWAAGYVADHFVAAGAHLPFDAITAIDDLGQRIEGLSGTGSLATLRVPDRTDFLMLVSLASGQSAANAA